MEQTLEQLKKIYGIEENKKYILIHPNPYLDGTPVTVENFYTDGYLVRTHEGIFLHPVNFEYFGNFIRPNELLKDEEKNFLSKYFNIKDIKSFYLFRNKLNFNEYYIMVFFKEGGVKTTDMFEKEDMFKHFREQVSYEMEELLGEE